MIFFCRISLRKIALLCRQRINYFLIFSIFNPASAASLVCLSSNLSNRSALIDKAGATCRMSNDLGPVFAECSLDKSMARKYYRFLVGA